MEPKEEGSLVKLFVEMGSDGYRIKNEDISDNGHTSDEISNHDPFEAFEAFLPYQHDASYSNVSSEEGSSSDISEICNLSPLPFNTNDDDDTNSSDDEWVDTVADVPDFKFDLLSAGVKLTFDVQPTPVDVFNCLWTDDIMDLLVTSTNNYGKKLENTNRPQRKNCRDTVFTETKEEELYRFLGICLLQAQVRFPILRKMFSNDPLYYHPVFSYAMSGRRFEQLLRTFNCTNKSKNKDRLNNINQLLKILIKNYQKAFSPSEAISLDESLILYRGRLSFKECIKKKAGIKFYELCSPNGYTHNIEMYKGEELDTGPTVSKLEALVFRLVEPFLDKGHHLVMDNYYNSVSLSNKLLTRKTHSTGTLRSNRKQNPKVVTTKKLKKGEYVWLRKGKVYVSKWRDKHEVLYITTKFQPGIIPVTNSYGKTNTKPQEMTEYQLNMSNSINRSDQLTSYYSCPRKSLRWYKKVIFHLLDVTIVNSFVLYREITDKKINFLEFRETLIRYLLNIPPDLNHGRQLVKQGAMNYSATSSKNVATPSEAIKHVLEKIPVPPNYCRKSYFLRCRECSRNGRRSQTSWRCRGCENTPPLCVGGCFEKFHAK